MNNCWHKKCREEKKRPDWRLRVDILNLFNDRNYVDYNNDPNSPNYLKISGIGVGGNPPRTVKLSAGFSF